LLACLLGLQAPGSAPSVILSDDAATDEGYRLDIRLNRVQPVATGIVGPSELVYDCLSMSFGIDREQVSARVHLRLGGSWNNSHAVDVGMADSPTQGHIESLGRTV